jgi:Co/Zn/Cd efflux system component
MHSRSLDHWTHEQVFLGVGHVRNERRSWLVVGLTGTMMVAEIIGGIVFGSMALLADGWHTLGFNVSGEFSANVFCVGSDPLSQRRS